uniref:Uncharacterized protein n=2 Tax=Zea mays TaxID=4577 RepID=A0A804PHX8_MAIZE
MPNLALMVLGLQTLPVTATLVGSVSSMTLASMPDDVTLVSYLTIIVDVATEVSLPMPSTMVAVELIPLLAPKPQLDLKASSWQEDAEKRNRKLHVDLTTAQARVAALESREAIAVEALKQAKDEHVQNLMEAYLVTHNQRRALRIQEPAPSNPVQPRRAEDPQILEGHPVSIRGEKKAWELPEGAIVLEGIPVSPQAMDKQEHPESSQDPPLELFEPLTMKKIPAPSLEVKEEAASTPPAPPPSEELQEPVPLEEEFDPVLPSQSPPEEVINVSSLLTHPGDVSD